MSLELFAFRLVAPLLFLEILHQLKQAFREQVADPRVCVLERMQPQGDQWFSGLFTVSNSPLNNWRRHLSNASRTSSSPPFGAMDLDSEEDLASSSSSSARPPTMSDGYWPSNSGFSLYELVLLVPVRYASPHASPSPTPRGVREEAAGDREAGGDVRDNHGSARGARPGEGSSSSSMTTTGRSSGDHQSMQKTFGERGGGGNEPDAETIIRMVAGRTFSAIAKVPMESSFLLGKKETHASLRDKRQWCLQVVYLSLLKRVLPLSVSRPSGVRDVVEGFPADWLLFSSRFVSRVCRSLRR